MPYAQQDDQDVGQACPNQAPSQPLPRSGSLNNNCLFTSAEVFSPPKEVPISKEDDSSSTTDQMPAGSFQQETRELATACWDPQGKEGHSSTSKVEDNTVNAISDEPFNRHKILTVFPRISSGQGPFKTKRIVEEIATEGMKLGEFKFEDYGHDNPEYIVCFTHSEDFSVEDFTEAIEAHEDFVECAIVIDPEEDDQYEGVFSSCPSYRQEE